MTSGSSLSWRALLLGRLAALAASSAGVATAAVPGATASKPSPQASRSGQHRSLRLAAQHASPLAAGADSAGADDGGQGAPDGQTGGLNASGLAATGAQCLLWQGDEAGCGAVWDRDLCLRSVDGRPWRKSKGRLVYGQPCAWCDGKNCLEGTPELCAPADWVRGWPGVTVASCSATTPPGTHDTGASGHGDAGLGAPPSVPRAGSPEGDAAEAPGFACGAEGAAVSSQINHFYYTFTVPSLDDCKRLCTSKGYCKAMEYQAHDARCLLWWHPVESAEPRLGHTCAVVRGAELVELNSTEAVALMFAKLNSTEVEALTLAKLNSTAAEAVASASSDPSTTAEQDFGELGSTSAKAETSASSDPSTTADDDFDGLGSSSAEAEAEASASSYSSRTADQYFGGLGSTSAEAKAEASASSYSSTTADQYFGGLGSTSAKSEASASSDPSTTADQDVDGLGSTSAEAETGIIVIMGDEPGATADQGFWSWPAAWRCALGGAALVAMVATCAPLLWWAAARPALVGGGPPRAAPRATRAAELQRPSDLQSAYVSDDLDSALVVTAFAEPVAPPRSLPPRSPPRSPPGAWAAPLPMLLGPAAAPSKGFFKRAAMPTGAYTPLAPRAEAVTASPRVEPFTRWATVGGPLPPTPPLTPRQPLTPRHLAPATPPLTPRQPLTPRHLASATPPLTPRQMGAATPPLTPRQMGADAPPLTPRRVELGLPFARPQPVAARPSFRPELPV